MVDYLNSGVTGRWDHRKAAKRWVTARARGSVQPHMYSGFQAGMYEDHTFLRHLINVWSSYKKRANAFSCKVPFDSSKRKTSEENRERERENKSFPLHNTGLGWLLHKMCFMAYSNHAQTLSTATCVAVRWNWGLFLNLGTRLKKCYRLFCTIHFNDMYV